MEEENKHSLLQPLIPLFSPSSSTTSNSSTTTFTTSSSLSSYSIHDYNNDLCNNSKLFISNSNIILRILLVLLVAAISIWANYEASRTFDVTIVNDAKDSLAGQRFALSYVSNDKATRIVLNTSSFVEHFLYPYDNNNKRYPKKHIESVTIRLSRRNLNATATATVTVTGDHQGGRKNFKGYYVIDINPVSLEGEDYNNMALIVAAIQRAMARVWLWDGGSRAPPRLVDGMAEYITELAGFRRKRVSGSGVELPECDGHQGWWWEDKDPRQVARYLHYYEKYKKGFIQRLNEVMRDTWHDRMVDEVLGVSSMKLCGLYNASVGSISSETRFVWRGIFFCKYFFFQLVVY